MVKLVKKDETQQINHIQLRVALKNVCRQVSVSFNVTGVVTCRSFSWCF